MLNRAHLLVLAGFWLAVAAYGSEPKSAPVPGCGRAVDNFFANEVWAKVGAQSCLKCHKVGGDAEDSNFILRDPQRSQGQAQDDDMRHNREEFSRMAKLKEAEKFRLLLK